MTSTSDAIQTAEQRCMRLVTLAENQAKEQQRILQDRIDALEQALKTKEVECEQSVKECSRQVVVYSKNLVECARNFERKHNNFLADLKKVSNDRAAVEGSAISRFKDALVAQDARRKQERKRRFQQTLNESNLRPAQLHLNGMKLDQVILDEEEIPFSMQAVLQYLVGAVAALEAFSERITKALIEMLRQEEVNRKGFLCSEERVLFKSSIRKLCSPFVECTSTGDADSTPVVSPNALRVILLQRLRDDRENRYEYCVEKLQEVYRQQVANTGVFLRDSNEKLGKQMQLLANAGIDSATIFLKPTQLDAASSPSPARGSKWAALKTNLSAVTQKEDKPLSVGPAKKGFASVVSDLMTKKGLSTDMPAGHVHQEFHSKALQNFVVLVNSMEEGIMKKLIDQHIDDYASIHGEYSFQMEQLVRNNVGERQVNYYQNVTVFSLEALQCELDHREVLARVFSERERSIKEKAENDVKSFQSQTSELNLQIAKLKRDLVNQMKEIVSKDKEIESLQSVAKVKHEGEEVVNNLKSECRMIEYRINNQSFGDTWQESLLKLREHILRELQNENIRFIARVKSVVRRQIVDDEQIELLYQARLQTALGELESDNQRRYDALVARVSAEKQHMTDMWQQRFDQEKQLHELQEEEWKKLYHAEYEAKLAQLNEQYDQRVRHFEASREEYEEYFNKKIVTMRKSIREKDAELDKRVADRYQELNTHFEGLSHELRLKYVEREKELDRDKLQVHANFDSKVNEKREELRAEFDELAQNLQQHVLMFLKHQRLSFESYREKEMQNFSQFAQISDKINSRRHTDLLKLQHYHHEEAIQSLKASTYREMEDLKEELKLEARRKEEAFMNRMKEVKENIEEMLVITQTLRTEQDEQFWNSCHKQLCEQEEKNIQIRSDVELLLQQRYTSLISKCEDYLANDITAARSAFEAEQAQRVGFLHNYCIYYHNIQLRLEQMLWDECSERCSMEKDFYSIMASAAIQEAEQRRTLLFCETLDEKPFVEVGNITVDQVRQIREEYEAKLLEKQKVITQMSTDILVAFETQFKINHNKIVKMEEVFEEKLNVLAVGLQEKFKVYYSSRRFLVENELKRIIDMAESNINALHSAATKKVQKENNSVGDPNAYWSEDVRVVDYFVNMKRIISKVMSEFEEKLEDLFSTQERDNRETFRQVHLEYVNASSGIMKQLEATKRRCDFAELALQQVRAKLSLESAEQERMKMVCSDMNSLIKKQVRSDSQLLSGAGATGDEVAHVRLPRKVLFDLTALREKAFSHEYCKMMNINEEKTSLD